LLKQVARTISIAPINFLFNGFSRFFCVCIDIWLGLKFQKGIEKGIIHPASDENSSEQTNKDWIELV
jgi:hypothetical protein